MKERLDRLDLATVSTVLVASLFPLALGLLLGFEPPWPDRPGYISGFLNAVVGFICCSRPVKSAEGLRRRQIMAFCVCALMLFAYLVLSGLFVHDEPTTGRKIVAGFNCTKDAALVVGAGVWPGPCPFLGSEVLESTGYRPDLIWTPLSIRVVEISIASVWTIFFVSATYALAISYVHADPRSKNRKPRSAT